MTAFGAKVLPNILFLFNYVMRVWEYGGESGCPWTQEEGTGCLVAGVTGRCESFDMGARNQMLVLFKSGKCC